MDIEGIGQKRTVQLIEAGLIKDLASLYALKKDDLLSLEGFAEKSAEKIIAEIESSKKQTLARFLYALWASLWLARVLPASWQSSIRRWRI